MPKSEFANRRKHLVAVPLSVLDVLDTTAITPQQLTQRRFGTNEPTVRLNLTFLPGELLDGKWLQSDPSHKVHYWKPKSYQLGQSTCELCYFCTFGHCMYVCIFRLNGSA